MGSLQRREKFNPFELEIVERVYEVACRYVEARDFYRPDANLTEEIGALRKMVVACAADGRLDFDAFCDKVLARLAEISPSRRAA